MTNRLGRVDPDFQPVDQGAPPRKEIPDRGQLRLGVIVLLVSLGVLFASSLVGYVIILSTSPARPAERLEIPGSLAVSTAILLLAGAAFHRCQRLARHLEFERSERWLFVTTLFTVGFLMVQVPGVMRLLIRHEMSMRDHVGFYGLTLSLIVLHALHVIGGLVPLTRLVVRAARAGINSTHVPAIRLCALYWHFLEGVWVTMYLTFLIVR